MFYCVVGAQNAQLRALCYKVWEAKPQNIVDQFIWEL